MDVEKDKVLCKKASCPSDTAKGLIEAYRDAAHAFRLEGGRALGST